MPDLNWKKSSYSERASSCLYLAATPDGTIKLRESDAPEVVLTTRSATLGALIRGIKAGEFDHLRTA
ncbi:hypothetical protein AQ490_00360 [Wenjunlia vitaminophila]|uniref:DUF397 domain-containing protein n=1 Tax=Wenjunlia vitaminophila TaxID=76728 RepID=A0A0T6LZ07_WENVI|nr:DUF397 domain-containing protein [Wenjunlia vitaminophila]KRV51261.1 hypothetical protein AQ490_00360 [Wenjunlia vitaminophila]